MNKECKACGAKAPSDLADIKTHEEWRQKHRMCNQYQPVTAPPRVEERMNKECKIDHCHECAKCGYERAMTEGEAEIAAELDKMFDELDRVEGGGWDWPTEFREYFDKTLKPKKPTMGNLDRELLVDFIRKVEAVAVESYKRSLVKKREALAELEHDQWIAWSKDIAATETITPARLERWKVLWGAYSELTEAQKDQDREWADKVLSIIKDTK